MNRLFLPIVLVFLSACAPSDAPEAKGRALLLGHGCMTCHRVGNEGGNVGPDLSFAGYRHTAPWLDMWLKDPRAWKPDTTMPVTPMQDAERKMMVDYLLSLKGQVFKGKLPWDAAELKDNSIKRGEMIYNRVGCLACHGPAGAGGYPNNNVKDGQIPPLKLVFDTYGRDQLKAKILTGSKPVKLDPAGADPLVDMPSWTGVLKDDEVEALVDYLFSLRPPKLKG